jgi:hypothetical protein
MMTLDERLRDGLHHAAERGGLDADEVFDSVRLSHGRGVVRTRIVRKATAFAVVLTLFAGVALFVSWRATPERFRSTATVGVAAQLGSSTIQPGVKLADPLQLALALSTTQAALAASHLPPDVHVDFRAKRAGKNVLALAATAPTARESSIVTRNWETAIAKARQVDARHRLLAARLAVNRRVVALHHQLQTVDAKLARLDPADYRGLLVFDEPNGNLPGLPAHAPPPVPENGTVAEFNLAFERIQILNELENSAKGAASLSLASPYPLVFTRLITQPHASHVDRIPPAALPALAGWFVALVLLVVGAALVFRRRVGKLIRG